MNDFQKARPGVPLSLSSRAWNRMLDTVNPGAGVNNPEAFEPRPISFSIIGFNTSTGSGADIPRWGCVAIAGVRPTPTGSETGTAVQQWEWQPAIVVGAPAESTKGRFAVALEPVAGGQAGLFAIDGVVQVKIDVNDSSHRFATPKPGSLYRMESADTGEATILWADNATAGNDRWALVRIGAGAGGGQIILGRITGTWTKGTTGVVWQYSGFNGSQTTGPSGAISVTGVNRFATIVAGSGESGKWVALGRIDQHWHLISAEC